MSVVRAWRIANKNAKERHETSIVDRHQYHMAAKFGVFVDGSMYNY